MGLGGGGSVQRFQHYPPRGGRAGGPREVPSTFPLLSVGIRPAVRSEVRGREAGVPQCNGCSPRRPSWSALFLPGHPKGTGRPKGQAPPCLRPFLHGRWNNSGSQKRGRKSGRLSSSGVSKDRAPDEHEALKNDRLGCNVGRRKSRLRLLVDESRGEDFGDGSRGVV